MSNLVGNPEDRFSHVGSHLQCNKSKTIDDDDEMFDFEMEYVRGDRRQSIIGTAVAESNANTRRMSLIGSTIGKDSMEQLPVIAQTIEEEK